MQPRTSSRLGLFLLLLTAAPPAHAADFTKPLPAPDLPAGTVTIKVVGQGMSDVRVGATVKLHAVGAAEKPAQPARTAITGDDGRARFEQLTPGASYAFEVTSEGGQVERSEPFTVPPDGGGLKFLVSLETGGNSVAGQTAPHAGVAMGQPPTDGEGGRLPPGHPPLRPGMLGNPEPDGASDASPVAEGQSGAALLAPSTELKLNELAVVVVRGRKHDPLAGATVVVSSRAASPHGGAAPAAAPAGAPPGQLIKGVTANDGTVHLAVPADQHTLRIKVAHQGLDYRSGLVRLPETGGLRATFVVFDRTRNLAGVQLGPRTRLVAQVGEDVLRFMLALELEQTADAIYDGKAGALRIPLPAGATGVEVPAELNDILVYNKERSTLELSAPLPPGSLPVHAFFALPYRRATQELSMTFPIPLASGSLLQVAGEVRPAIFGPALKDAIPPRGQGNEVVSYPLEALAAGRPLEVTFSQLPVADRSAALISATIGGLFVLCALIAAVARLGGRKQRLAEQQRLLAELKATATHGDPARMHGIVRALLDVW